MDHFIGTALGIDFLICEGCCTGNSAIDTGGGAGAAGGHRFDGCHVAAKAPFPSLWRGLVAICVVRLFLNVLPYILIGWGEQKVEGGEEDGRSL